MLLSQNVDVIFGPLCSTGKLEHYLAYPPKNDTVAQKTEPRIKREYNVGYILCKVPVWKWPVVKDKHIKMKPRTYVLFVSDLDGESLKQWW